MRSSVTPAVAAPIYAIFSNLLADDPDYLSRARMWDNKLRDIHEWLVEIDLRDPLPNPSATPRTVTYHDSCHLAHGQKVVSAPRKILRKIPGLTLVDLTEADWCCGSAGVYSITQPQQAAELLDRKVAHIDSTGATVLATGQSRLPPTTANGLHAAGLPVTHRRAGSSVTFVTGHEEIDKDRPGVDWRGLARSSDGLVIYMGLHNLRRICEELIAGGLAEETPAAVIQQGTVRGQRDLVSYLGVLADRVEAEGFGSPSIVVIGQVVEERIPQCAPEPADAEMPIPF